MNIKKPSKEYNVEIKAGIPLLTSTFGSKWTKDEKGINVSSISGDEISLLPGDDFNVVRPIIGNVSGFSSQEIKKMGLYVDISIKTDTWYPQGIAKVQSNGEWVLEVARFAATVHLVKIVLKDKNDNELSSAHFTVIVKRLEGQLRDNIPQVTERDDSMQNGRFVFLRNRIGDWVDSGYGYQWRLITIWLSSFEKDYMEKIEKVEFHLPDSFAKSNRGGDIKDGKFYISTAAYGDFNVSVEVFLKGTKQPIILNRLINVNSDLALSEKPLE